MSLIRHLASFKRLSAFTGAAFLCVMLVEWGAHGLAFVHAERAGGLVGVSGTRSEHDDPCRTTVCCENRRNGQQQAPNLSHEVFPYSLSPDDEGVLRPVPIREIVTNPRQAADRIFRPKDPLLH